MDPLQHLIRITDSRGQPQFAVGLDPNRKTVEFSIKKYDGSLQTLSWERPQGCTYYYISLEFYWNFIGTFLDQTTKFIIRMNQLNFLS